MTRAEKIKKEHIQKVNRLVEQGFKNPEIEQRPIVLKPSQNMQNKSKEFLNKMNNLL
tara:strand:+ start:357 stop:527 length:171 start_codon:yes stop_codon:yes gene_type:complete